VVTGQSQLALDLSPDQVKDLSGGEVVSNSVPSQYTFYLFTNANPEINQWTANRDFEDAIRYGIDYKSKIRVNKRGKKLTFRLTARYINNAGKPVGIRKATIQVKKGGTWKTLKNVKLKSNGTGKYKRSDKKKRQYRMVIKTTNTYLGGNTRGSIKL
jgi:hypothetical protein